MSRVLALNPEADMVMRRPTRNDGAAVWRLVGESEALEQNSAYAYLLLCTHFCDTCLVAEEHASLAGCALAYRLPREPRSLFVWQIGVAATARGRGLASELLDGLLGLPACRSVQYLCASVTAGNAASRALFVSFARRHRAELRERRFLDAGVFPGKHAAEPMLRIGPLCS